MRVTAGDRADCLVQVVVPSRQSTAALVLRPMTTYRYPVELWTPRHAVRRNVVIYGAV